MKKIFFTLICVLACIGLVYARDVSDLKEQWHFDLVEPNQEFSLDDRYVYYNNTVNNYNEDTGEYELAYKLTSLNRVTKVEKSVLFDSYIRNFSELDGNLIVDSGDYLYKYDRDLNLIKKKKNTNGFYFGTLLAIDGVIKSNDFNSNEFIIDSDLNITTTLKNDDGSFFVINDNVLELYDKDEKLIDSLEDTYVFRSMVYLDGYYYATATSYLYYVSSSTQSAVKIYKISKNFDVIKEVELESCSNFVYRLFVNNDKLYADTSASLSSTFTYSVNKETLETTEVDYVRNTLYDGGYYSNYFYNYIFNYLDNDNYMTYDEYAELHDFFGSGIFFNKSDKGDYLASGVFDGVGAVGLFDNNFDSSLMLELPTENDEISATFYGDNIAVYRYDDGGLVEIYNRDGKLLKTIELEVKGVSPVHVYLVAAGNSLTLIRGIVDDEWNSLIPASYNATRGYVMDKTKTAAADIYYEMVLIDYDPYAEASIVGEGTVNIETTNYVVGDTVIFSYEPKDGYEVAKVIVKDADGNEIEVKNNSFVMPASNVTIEVEFKEIVKNPNTGVFLRVGIAMIIAFVCFYFIVLRNMKVKQFE